MQMPYRFSFLHQRYELNSNSILLDCSHRDIIHFMKVDYTICNNVITVLCQIVYNNKSTTILVLSFKSNVISVFISSSTTESGYLQNDLLIGFLNAVRRPDKHSLNFSIIDFFTKTEKQSMQKVSRY